jgi:hypothetical protein
MTLKMNIRPVRLAQTGRHLFDAPYCYRQEVTISDAVLTKGGDCFYASRDLTEVERTELFRIITAANEQQEREWGLG